MQGEIYRTIKATQMCAPFQREEMGARRWRSVREEGCMRSGAVSTQAGIEAGYVRLCWDTHRALVKDFVYMESSVLRESHLASGLRYRGVRFH